MTKETVLITGASGFVAQHFIARLQTNVTDIVAEIRLFDRRPFRSFLDYRSHIPIKFYPYDICDTEHLYDALESCTTVFHCAGKPYEYLSSSSDASDSYLRDNIEATETLVNAMIKMKVPRIVFVGDAYANLPIGDNYGVSEEMHMGLPDNYMLGFYGESKTKAEVYARSAVEKGEMSGLFLRPTIIYGEGERHMRENVLKVCKYNGGYQMLEGRNRGNHQNLAAIMERSLRCLLQNPSKYSGEVIYCMDKTVCRQFSDVMKPFIELEGYSLLRERNYFLTVLNFAYYEILKYFGLTKTLNNFTLEAYRFLHGWSVGFTNRKLRLLLDFVPEYEQDEALLATLSWYKAFGHEKKAIYDSKADRRDRG